MVRPWWGNHRDGIAAMDFRHVRRDMVRRAFTTTPTAAWLAQQRCEAFPFESAPRFLIFDRDAIFPAGLTATIRSMLMEPALTSNQSPWQDGVAERFAGTVRRELLDHVSVLDERHLRQPIESFVTHYNVDRTHIGWARTHRAVVLSKRGPALRSTSSASPGSAACITATPGVKQRRPGRHPQFIQISPPPASAEGDRVPAGRWCRPSTRLTTRSRPRFRRQHPAPPRFKRRSVHRSCLGERQAACAGSRPPTIPSRCVREAGCRPRRARTRRTRFPGRPGERVRSVRAGPVR